MTILIINTGLKIFATKVLRALGEIGLSEMENLHIVFAAKEKLTKKNLTPMLAGVLDGPRRPFCPRRPIFQFLRSNKAYSRLF